MLEMESQSLAYPPDEGTKPPPGELKPETLGLDGPFFSLLFGLSDERCGLRDLPTLVRVDGSGDLAAIGKFIDDAQRLPKSKRQVRREILPIANIVGPRSI